MSEAVRCEDYGRQCSANGRADEGGQDPLRGTHIVGALDAHGQAHGCCIQGLVHGGRQDGESCDLVVGEPGTREGGPEGQHDSDCERVEDSQEDPSRNHR